MIGVDPMVGVDSMGDALILWAMLILWLILILRLLANGLWSGASPTGGSGGGGPDPRTFENWVVRPPQIRE